LLSNFILALAIAGLFVGPMFKYSTAYLVTLKREREDASFFKRNKDRLIVGLLFFVLGIVATLIAEHSK
jgi:cell division protein FtsW (lipid II flippase)